MKRFLVLVGVAVVAAAMYVAASPASQQSSGPTAKQFKALQRQVTSLSKTVKAVKTLAVAEAVLLIDCTKDGAVPVDLGTPNAGASAQGYEYSEFPTPDGGNEMITTALDAASTNDQTAIYFMGGDSTCATAAGGGLRHAAARAGLQLPHALSHRPAWVAHRR